MTVDESHKQIVLPAIAKAEREIPNLNFKSFNDTTPLYGPPGAVLDSLNLVSFVFLLENFIESQLKKKIEITTANVLNGDRPPFANAFALSEFLAEKLK